MTESNEQVKVLPRDIPLVADTIKEGFIEDGWQDAGTYPVKGGMAMGFLDSDRKFLAVVSLLKDGKGVSCSYKVDKFNPENVESEDKDGNPILAIGGIAAIAASAIAFPMATLGAAIVGLGAALFSGSTEDEVTAKAIAIIRRQLTDIEEAVFGKRKIPKSRKYDIFISYRHDKGREFGRKLYEVYKKKGLKVFFYQFSSSKIQRTINEATCNAVRNSKHVLVILTPGFFDKCTSKDDGCRVEIETALEEGKSIVPIRLDGYSGKEIPAGLPERLADFAQWQGINISDLAPDVSVIKAIAERMRLNLRNSGKTRK